MINEDFIFKNEGSHPFGYVPVKERRITSQFRGLEGTVIGNSGVTVGMGLDLGQRANLDDLNLSPQLQAILTPYLELKKVEAQNKLKDLPLDITKEEEYSLNCALIESYSKRAESCWNKSFNIKYQELNENQRTCIFDLIYQHGNIFSPKHRSNKAFEYFIECCKIQDWDNASLFLDNLDNGFLNRNKKRAELLK